MQQTFKVAEFCGSLGIDNCFAGGFQELRARAQPPVITPEALKILWSVRFS